MKPHPQSTIKIKGCVVIGGRKGSRMLGGRENGKLIQEKWKLNSWDIER
jgi:hypothetical protein